jgi:hypothetical protein
MVYKHNFGIQKEGLSKLIVLTAALLFAFAAAIGIFNIAGATTNAVTPSTNDVNRDNGWAHFNVLETRVGEVDIEFVSTRAFLACFEFRSDNNPTTDTRSNFNTNISDGLWPFVCVNNSTATKTLSAEEYVEIRMVFGAETDERFDWTRVDVLPQLTKEDCKNDGWKDLGYRNQGLCVSSFATQKSQGNAPGNRR